ncbi:hypothetical protein [Leclercia sp. M50]|uniref:hypothetical protein n=1 Tax=Leclercia sp. M50 TaxID=3081258 RepID=UPI003017FE07
MAKQLHAAGHYCCRFGTIIDNHQQCSSRQMLHVLLESELKNFWPIMRGYCYANLGGRKTYWRILDAIYGDLHFYPL